MGLPEDLREAVCFLASRAFRLHVWTSRASLWTMASSSKQATKQGPVTRDITEAIVNYLNQTNSDVPEGRVIHETVETLSDRSRCIKKSALPSVMGKHRSLSDRISVFPDHHSSLPRLSDWMHRSLLSQLCHIFNFVEQLELETSVSFLSRRTKHDCQKSLYLLAPRTVNRATARPWQSDALLHQVCLCSTVM